MSRRTTVRRRPSRAPDLVDLGQRFQALSDPTRTRIVEMLAATGERCVCELADELEMPQPLLSFHLRTLRESGLIRGRRNGRWTHYALDPRTLEEAGQALARVAATQRDAEARRQGCC